MKNAHKQKVILSVTGALVAITLFFCAGLRVPVLDSQAESYFTGAISKAGLAYATCRVVNASVSVVKESNLQLEPAGVGVSLAVGQALDPIDDMAERLSDVLVTAITSLGVQKLAYEISLSLVPPVMAVFLLVLSVLIWFKNERVLRLRGITVRVVIILIVARFCLPFSSLANEFIQKHFFDDQISKSNKELALGSAELDKLKDFSLPEFDGLLKTIEKSASFIKRSTIEFKKAIVATVSNMGEIIESLLELTFLYVGLFLVQVIILPLLTFWFFVKVLNSLFDTNVPLILRHSSVLKGVPGQPARSTDRK